MKEAIGLIAALLVFVAYGPYIHDILKGKTKPHPYSWFVWAFLTSIIFALQVTHGAGAGSYVTSTVAVLSFFISGLGVWRGTKDITLFDTLCFLLALFATSVWVFAKQPTASMILLVSIDMLGFAPTVRKSWSKPQQETLLTWEVNGFRHAISILAIQKYSLLTILNPAVWTIANGLFSVMLIARRKSRS